MSEVQKSANVARNEAMKRLMAAHPHDWKKFLAEERVSRGLPEEPANRQRKQTKQARIEYLESLLREKGVEFE